MVQFKLSPDADTNFTSLQASVELLHPETMRRKFGPCHRESCEEDKGYRDGEWFFTDEDDNVYTVYFRWGVGRIGAMPENRGRANELIAFLRG